MKNHTDISFEQLGLASSIRGIRNGIIYRNKLLPEGAVMEPNFDYDYDKKDSDVDFVEDVVHFLNPQRKNNRFLRDPAYGSDVPMKEKLKHDVNVQERFKKILARGSNTQILNKYATLNKESAPQFFGTDAERERGIQSRSIGLGEQQQQVTDYDQIIRLNQGIYESLIHNARSNPELMKALQARYKQLLEVPSVDSLRLKPGELIEDFIQRVNSKTLSFAEMAKQRLRPNSTSTLRAPASESMVGEGGGFLTVAEADRQQRETQRREKEAQRFKAEQERAYGVGLGGRGWGPGGRGGRNTR